MIRAWDWNTRDGGALYCPSDLTDDQNTDLERWVTANVDDYDRIWIFRVETDLVDCPLIRIFWIGRDELRRIPSGDLEPLPWHTREIPMRIPVPESLAA